MKRLGSRGEFAVLAAIMLVAVFFRTFRLDTVPGGLTDDEAHWGIRASRVAHGETHPIFFDDDKAIPEPMFGYSVALAFKLLGPSILAARTLSALAGIITVPVFYLLVKEVFPRRAGRAPLPLYAVLATSWLATSYWHVIYSRYVIECILLPLLCVSAFYFLWRGINSDRLWCFACSGFLLGVGVYTYQAGRVLPFFVLLYLIYLAWRDRWSVRSSGFKIVLLLGICFVVVVPLAGSAIQHPEAFLSRAREVSIFNPELNQGSPIRSLATGVVNAAAMFSLRGDPYPERNPGDRSLLDPLTSLLFLAGLGMAIVRSREREYAFVWLWFLVMCLPAALTISEIPNFSRAIGAFPAAYVLAAIALADAYEAIDSRLRSTRLRQVFLMVLLATPLLFASVTTYRDYFGAYARRQDLPRRFDIALIEASNVMNETDAVGAVWIWPTTSLVTGQHIFSHPGFLYHGDSPYFFLSCDDRSGADDLTAICQGTRRALVLEWKGYVQEKVYEAIAADPKNLISFLLQKYGRELERRRYEAFDVVTYQVPESTVFSIAENFEPLTVNFGGELMLTGMALGGSSLQDTSSPQDVEQTELPSGKNGWVVLRWRALTEPSRNYKVSVYLQDEGGHVAGQVDKLLLSNYLHPTQDWQAGQEEIDYYTLPSWPATAPGRYKVGVTLYDAENLDVVPIVGGGQSYELGAMKIVRPLMAAQVQPQTAIEEDKGELAPGIRLLGYDLPRREVSPGDELSVALYWQALEDINRDYLLAVQLTDEQGEVGAERFDSPVYGTYPTTEWSEGEVLKDWHNVSLPPDMPQGQYEVFVRVLEGEEPLGEAALGRFEVRGPARVFAMPQMQHPMDITLGEGVLFLGYDLSSNEVKPGEILQLTLYWQALEEMETSYTVFTHLLDAENQIWGQMDGIPGKGESPTTSWIEGEVISDGYQILVDPEAPVDEYTIEIGMYDAKTGSRLSVLDTQGQPGDDRILLQTVRVIAAEGKQVAMPFKAQGSAPRAPQIGWGQP